jgi:cytochrome c5
MWKGLLSLAFISLFSLTGIQAHAQDYDGSPAPTPTTSSFGFSDLLSIIQTKNITSIDDLIPALPASYRKYFVTMVKSGSLQYASPESPRIISYGNYSTDDGNRNEDHLYIGFQTDKVKRTGVPNLPNALEVIEWKPAQKIYQFYQIDFAQNTKPTVTTPTTCLSCHGNPGRPNWSAYPRWDGAIGNGNGLDGVFVRDLPSTDPSVSHALMDGLQAANTRLAAMDFSEYFTADLEYPNAYLSSKVSDQLTTRNIELFRSNPNYKKLKYALAGAMMECSNFDDFFGSDTLKAMREGVFANLKNTPKTSFTANSADDLNFLALFKMTSELIQRNGVHFGQQYADDGYITTWLRFLFEGQGQADLLRNILGNPPVSGPNDSAWTYDYVGFAEDIISLSSTFLNVAEEDFPEMMTLISDNHTEDGSPLMANSISTDTCTELAALSKKATENLKIQPLVMSNPPATGANLSLFQHYCTTCHASGDHALPLTDLTQLRNYRMTDGNTIADRLKAMEMPMMPAAQPTTAERESMINALNAQ